MSKILIGIISAAISAGVTYIFTKKAYEKKMDALAEKTSNDMAAMDDQLKAIHKVFIEEQPTTVASERQKLWDSIADEYRPKPKPQPTPKTDEEVAKEFKEGILKAREQKKVDYQAYSEMTKQYTSDDDEDSNPFATIYEITEEEYHNGDPGYEKVELDFYFSDDMLYDEHQQPIDEPRGELGMSITEVIDRAIMVTETNEEGLFVRNEDLKTDYEVNIHAEDIPSPYSETV